MNFLRDADNQRLVAAKTSAASIITAPAVGRAIDRLTRGVVPAYGMRIDTRSPAVDDRVRAQLLWRLYEGAEIRMARRHLGAETHCIVDLGASLGVLGAFSCRAAGGRVRYLGVEANPDLVPTARQNLQVNAPHADATVLHGAIDYSQSAGVEAVFDASGIHLGAALASNVPVERFVAPVLRLGDLVEDLAVESYTLLMDVEGAETGVFLEDRSSLATCDLMVVEVHDSQFRGTPYVRSEVLEHALSCGFDVAESYGSAFVLRRSDVTS